jgi:hypothetical protein
VAEKLKEKEKKLTSKVNMKERKKHEQVGWARRE